MLEEFFAGDPGGDWLPTQFAEIAWEKGEVYKAMARHYGADESQNGDCKHFVPNGGLGR